MVIATSYLPPVLYLAEVLRNGCAVVDIHETYTKQTCRNRCHIYGPNGRQALTVPVTKPFGNHTKTKDIRISNTLLWQKMHWRSIETAYNNSPFFLYYQDDFHPLFKHKFEQLVTLNNAMLEVVFKCLNMTVPLSYSDDFILDYKEDKRDQLVSKKNNFKNREYPQPFAAKHGFIPNLSIIDLIFNLGPESIEYLQKL